MAEFFGNLRIETGLESYLMVGAILFALGLYGALSRKSAIQILMALELMACAVNLNLVAFSRFTDPQNMNGLFFSIFSMVVSAAEIGLGLGLVVAVFRRLRTSEVDEADELKG